MSNAFCCSLSLFRVLAKIKKTVPTAPVSPTNGNVSIIITERITNGTESHDQGKWIDYS